MNKKEQIEVKKIKPIVVGDYVDVRVAYTTQKEETEGIGKKKVTKIIDVPHVFKISGRVHKITNDANHGLLYHVDTHSITVPSQIQLEGVRCTYDNGGSQYCFKACNVYVNFDECGANNFKKERFRVDFYNQDISSLLMKASYGRHDTYNEPVYRTVGGGSDHDKQFDGIPHGGVNFNPFVFDSEGKKQFYQRDLIWTLEQKQLLIDSIYNGIEIGKFLWRYNSWKKIEKAMIEEGHGYSFDCVDGKQRFFAILHFIQGKYADSYGNYWDDLSIDAHRKFLSYHNLSYGEMGERATDSDVIDTFLTLNFTGTPMTKEHIEYVQTFNMK